jgi:hypothetical protein
MTADLINLRLARESRGLDLPRPRIAAVRWALELAVVVLLVLFASASWGADPQPRPLDGPIMPGDL